MLIKLLNSYSSNYEFLNSEELAKQLKEDENGIECINFFWNKMKEKYGDKYPTIWPSYIISFLEEKKLQKDFYPYYQCKEGIFNILSKSNNYISIEDKYNIFAEKFEKYEIEILEKKNEDILNDLFTKINNENFTKDKIKFKKLDKNNKKFCYYDKGNIIFSSEALKETINNEWKFWFIVKILNFSNIKLENSYNIFCKAFKLD